MDSISKAIMADDLSPLMWAIVKNKIGKVKALLEAGASPFKPNGRGHTAFDMASWGENPEIKRTLQEAAADMFKGNKVFTMLMCAVQLGHIDSAAEYLKHEPVDSIDRKGKYGRTALTLACIENRAYVAKALVEAGADATLCSEDGMTPLFWASYNGNVQTMRMLIRAGADPVRQMDWGKRPTALHFAALNGNPLAVKELLLAGAQPSALDDWGRTPLHAATMKRHSGALAEIVRVLKAGRTDPKLFGSTETIAATLAIRDRSGKTAVHYAIETMHGPSVMVLLDAGAVDALNNAHIKRRLGHHAAGGIGPTDVFQPNNKTEEIYMARTVIRKLAFSTQSWRWPAREHPVLAVACKGAPSRGGYTERNNIRAKTTVARVFRAKQGKSRHLELTEAMFGYAIKNGS